MITPDDGYVPGEATGNGWTVLLGDTCERLTELGDNSVDLAVESPPFDKLFNYTPSPRDLSNNRTREEFLEHYGYVIREKLRVVKPGRISCVHVQQITKQKVLHGEIGLTDFRGEVIAAHEAAGWGFWGEVTVDKDPQAQAIRTKASTLLFVTKERDASQLRPALADYLLMFKKPGDVETPVKTDVTNEEWIAWARPVWLDIRETHTLNVSQAREDADERHICPLQLDFVERCVRLYSNRGETVLSPFAGIGSEGFVAVQHGRRFVGIELKGSYWSTAVDNLRKAEALADDNTLFDEEASA